ncbi:MAG: DNA primase [Candidatus Omnitrophica bacterium]|nr:DNA primase [Candidatus Omnitrophota bacterium]
MAIPETIIEQVQARSDIVEVISRYVPLKKAGRNFKAPCPFHHEKTPSFVVSPDKQIYHCFGCGAGGNVFSFLMKQENLQFPEVIEMLAENAGIVLPREISKGGPSELDSRLYKVNELASQFFQTNLVNDSTAREYLTTRGVGEEIIKKFKIGCAPDAWEGLLNYLKSKGIEANLSEKAGLAVSNEKGGHYDRFRNRVTFPIIDLKDRILGFGARIMDSSLPKYINSPETPIYSKGRNLYGLNFSRDAIKKKGHALIVEGYLDYLVPYQAGIQNIIATLGTALTVDQAKLLKRFAKTVVLVYDSDEAGESASMRGLDIFVSEDMNVYIAELPKGLDPDSYIRKNGAEDFIKLIKSSKNIFDYKFDKLSKRFNSATTNGKAGIVNEMLPTISKIGNAVAKSEMIKKLSKSLSVDEDAVKAELKKVKPDFSERRSIIVPAEIKRDVKKAEIAILAVLLDGRGDYADIVKRALPLEEIKSSSVRDIVNVILLLRKDNKEINAARLMNHFGSGSESTSLISEAVNVLDSLDDKEKALYDCISRIKKDNVKDRLTTIQEAIRMAHSQKDEVKVKELVAEYNSLVKLNK